MSMQISRYLFQKETKIQTHSCQQPKGVRRRQTLVKREHGFQEKSLFLNFLLCLLFSELKDLCGALC